MAKFTVDSEQMNTAMAAAHTELTEVQSHATALTSTLTALESSWQGQASAAFLQVVDQWRATQAQVEDSISGINQALGAAAEHYGSAEGDVVRLFAM